MSSVYWLRLELYQVQYVVALRTVNAVGKLFLLTKIMKLRLFLRLDNVNCRFAIDVLLSATGLSCISWKETQLTLETLKTYALESANMCSKHLTTHHVLVLRSLDLPFTVDTEVCENRNVVAWWRPIKIKLRDGWYTVVISKGTLEDFMTERLRDCQQSYWARFC